MAKKKPRATSGFAFFDVFYEGGGRSSNRRVPKAVLEGLEGDARVLAFFEEQDCRIAELSGNPPRLIARVARSDAASAAKPTTPRPTTTSAGRHKAEAHQRNDHPRNDHPRKAESR